MSKMETLLRFDVRHNIDAEGYPTGHVITHAAQGVDHLNKVVREYKAAKDRIRTDRNLTEEGRRKKLEPLGAEYLAKLKPVMPILENLKQKRDEAKKVIDFTPEADPREAEWRQHLLQMDKSKRFQVFIKAVETQDELTFKAFVNAPTWLDFLLPEVLEDGKRRWAERTHPKETQAAATLVDAYDRLSGNFDQVHDAIAEDSGMTADLRTRMLTTDPEDILQGVT